MRSTKIICTMGPNTDKKTVMKSLVKNGMNVARFNFSHGDHEEQRERMNLLKNVREELDRPVAILLDTKGPEIRTGLLEGGKKVTLREGSEFILYTEEMTGKAEIFLEKGCTVIYLAVDNRSAGFIALSDILRQNAADTIDAVKDCGVTPVLLTGDHENAAGHIARQLHISEMHANCLPEDKLIWIDSYEQQNQPVCMIGDGINDAPALKKACVGIAMGKIGSDIAVDAADIALVNDDIRELPHLLRLAKRMMTTIRLNLTFSMTLNFVAIILAITGILNPVVGALVHNAGSVLVIINSALLLRWKEKQKKR